MLLIIQQAMVEIQDLSECFHDFRGFRDFNTVSRKSFVFAGVLSVIHS